MTGNTALWIGILLGTGGFVGFCMGLMKGYKAGTDARDILYEHFLDRHKPPPIPDYEPPTDRRVTTVTSRQRRIDI